MIATPHQLECAERILGPIRLRCQSHEAKGEPAVGVLFAPDGEPVPGGWFCRIHGERVVLEFAEKMGESWTLAVPLSQCTCCRHGASQGHRHFCPCSTSFNQGR